jgi:transcriptional regulator with XRE-family HTH domain
MRTVSRFGPFCKRAGISVRHLERLLSKGKGPPTIDLGDRIRGLFDDDGDAWLASRRKAPPGWVDTPVEPSSPPLGKDAASRTAAQRGGSTAVELSLRPERRGGRRRVTGESTPANEEPTPSETTS